jgi:hypothetical protein
MARFLYVANAQQQHRLGDRDATGTGGGVDLDGDASKSPIGSTPNALALSPDEEDSLHRQR